MPSSEREIEHLLHRYADALDDGDLDAVADLLAEATVRDPSGAAIASGRDEVRALYEATTRLYPDGTPRTHHVITNVIIEVDPADPDRATGRARFTVLQATDGLALQPIIAGRYADRFERVDGTWRFVERVMQPTLLGDLTHHLLFDPDLLDQGAPDDRPT